jgi:chromosome segregation ATPase
MKKAHKFISEKEDPQDNLMLKQRIIHLNSELTKYKEKIQQYQDDYHYSQLETLKVENACLKETIDELKKEQVSKKKEYTEKITKLSESLNYHQTKEKENLLYIKQLETENSRIQDLLSESESKNKELLSQIQNFEVKYDDEKLKGEQFQGMLKMLKDEQEILRKTNEELEIANERYSQENKKYAINQNLIETELEEAKGLLISTQQKNHKLSSEIEHLNKEKTSYKKAQKELLSELQNLKQEIGGYSISSAPAPQNRLKPDEIKRLTNQIENLSIEINRYEKGLPAYLQQIENLEQQIEDLTSIVEKLQETK